MAQVLARYAYTEPASARAHGGPNAAPGAAVLPPGVSNHAVARVAQPKRVLARYAYTDPVNEIAKQTARVGKSGSGNTGALWLEDTQGNRVWVKAQDAPSERQVFAEQVLKMVGVSGPGTRTLTPDEAKQLYYKVIFKANAQSDLDTKGKAQAWFSEAHAKSHVIMGSAKGTSAGSARKEADTTKAAELNTRFVGAFRNSQFAEGIGRMFAADQLLGNADRISAVRHVQDRYAKWAKHAHADNFMVAEEGGQYVLTAIDNDAIFHWAFKFDERNFEDILKQTVEGLLGEYETERGDVVTFAAGVEALFDPAAALDTLKFMIKTYRGFGALFNGFTDGDAVKFVTSAYKGWKEARETLMREMPNIKKLYYDLLVSAGGGKGAPEVRGFEEWDFRARRVYAQIRQEPTIDVATAKTEAQQYLVGKYSGETDIVARIDDALKPPPAPAPADAGLAARAQTLQAILNEVNQTIDATYSGPGGSGGLKKLHRLRLKHLQQAAKAGKLTAWVNTLKAAVQQELNQAATQVQAAGALPPPPAPVVLAPPLAQNAANAAPQAPVALPPPPVAAPPQVAQVPNVNVRIGAGRRPNPGAAVPLRRRSADHHLKAIQVAVEDLNYAAANIEFWHSSYKYEKENA
jgi:hypothetical protein